MESRVAKMSWPNAATAHGTSNRRWVKAADHSTEKWKKEKANRTCLCHANVAGKVYTNGTLRGRETQP